MAGNACPQLKSGGTINPSCFIKVSTAANQTALQAGAGDLPIGISMEGSQQSPNLNTTYAAATGDFFKFYALGDVCLLTIGSGGCTAGDALKSDANGNGVTGTVGTDKCGAIALETAASGELAMVQIVILGT